MTFKEFMEFAPTIKPSSLDPNLPLKDYNAVKKLNVHKRGENKDFMRRKGPDPSKVIMPPVIKHSGSMTLKRAGLKTMPKDPADFLPRNSGNAPTTKEKGIRLASL